mgnify:CR=1 FL=1
MKAFYDFLEQHNLSFEHPNKDSTNFFIYTKKRDQIPFHFTLEKDWHIKVKKPIYYLRSMSRKLNYFPSEEDEQQFFQSVFLFFKKWADTYLSYSYVFFDELFIYDSHLQTRYKIEQQWKELLMYSCSYQFCSVDPSPEIEVYANIRKHLNEMIQEESKRDPRIYLEYSQNTSMRIYTPNISMGIGFSFHEFSLKITVKRSGKRDKVTMIPLDKQEDVSSLLSDWFLQLYRENQLTQLFNESKKTFFHQMEYAQRIKPFSISPLFHWLEQHHTNEEIEQMAAIERRKRGDLFIESALLKECYYLVPFHQYYFMFQQKGLFEVFTGMDEEEALTHFYEKLTFLFHENMRKEQKEMKKHYKL